MLVESTLKFKRPRLADLAVTADKGAKVAAIAAIVWFAFGVESIVRPVQDNTRDAVWLLPGALTVITFWFVHKVQRSTARRLERIAFRALMLFSLVVFTVVIANILNLLSLAMFTAGIGIVSWIVGLVVYGIATWRAGVLPRWAALAIILFEPGSVLTGLALSPISPLRDQGSYSAGVEKGAAVAIVALGLISARNAMRGRGDTTSRSKSHSKVEITTAP